MIITLKMYCQIYAYQVSSYKNYFQYRILLSKMDLLSHFINQISTDIQVAMYEVLSLVFIFPDFESLMNYKTASSYFCKLSHQSFSCKSLFSFLYFLIDLMNLDSLILVSFQLMQFITQLMLFCFQNELEFLQNSLLYCNRNDPDLLS